MSILKDSLVCPKFSTWSLAYEKVWQSRALVFVSPWPFTLCHLTKWKLRKLKTQPTPNQIIIKKTHTHTNTQNPAVSAAEIPRNKSLSTRNQPVVICVVSAPSINRDHFLGEGMLPVQLLIWCFLFKVKKKQKTKKPSYSLQFLTQWERTGCRWWIMICVSSVLMWWISTPRLLTQCFFFPGEHCREDVLLSVLQMPRNSRTSGEPRATSLPGTIQLWHCPT